MRPVLLCAISLLVAINAATAQKTNAGVLGKWKGESLCMVKPSACHDETVVYEITAPSGAKDKLVMNADKIVEGKPVNMGSLDCKYADAPYSITCDVPGRGVWSFTVEGDVMTGMLKLSDGTVFRKVSTKRVR